MEKNADSKKSKRERTRNADGIERVLLNANLFLYLQFCARVSET